MSAGSLNLMGRERRGGGGGGCLIKSIVFRLFPPFFLSILTTFHSIEKRLSCFRVISSMKFGESLDDFSNVVICIKIRRGRLFKNLENWKMLDLKIKI